MISIFLSCPVCQTAIAPHETACSSCGRVFTDALPDTPSHPFAKGQTLANGRYTIERLSQGRGNRIAFLAIDHEAFDRIVVVKALADDDEADVPQAYATAEAHLLASLRHPVIPQMYSFFREGSYTCIVMEWFEGECLANGLTRQAAITGQTITGRPYPRHKVIEWGITLCQLLDYLHSRPIPIVQADLSPANLMLDAHSGDIRITKVIHNNEPGYDDVCALAATLYHLATDNDPRQSTPTSTQFEQLGLFGSILSSSLQANTQLRPDARSLRAKLETLITSVDAPLQAPDGSSLHDTRALVAWCEQHWDEAEQWLVESLGEQLAIWWGRTQLAGTIEASAHKHNHPALALDDALAMLEPHDFGKQQSRIDIDRRQINYGMVPLEGAASALVTISNSGRRCARVTVTTPPWIVVNWHGAALVIPPGQQRTIALEAQGPRVPWGGRLLGKVGVSTAFTFLLIDTYVALPFWQWWWRRYGYLAILAVVIILAALIIMYTLL